MRFISAVVTVIILCAILENFLPWWCIAPVAFVVSYLFRLKWYSAFLSGFLALFLLWGGMAFLIDRANEQILSNRISMLILKSSKPLVIVAITGVIGGLVAGLGGLAGSFLIKKK